MGFYISAFEYCRTQRIKLKNIVKPECFFFKFRGSSYVQWGGDVIISDTEHNIQYVNLSDTYKHCIGILPCFSDHISMILKNKTETMFFLKKTFSSCIWTVSNLGGACAAIDVCRLIFWCKSSLSIKMTGAVQIPELKDKGSPKLKLYC